MHPFIMPPAGDKVTTAKGWMGIDKAYEVRYNAMVDHGAERIWAVVDML